MARPDDEAADMYWNKAKNRWQPRRGTRKKSHGPMSGAEKAMSRAFQNMLIREMHWMDGELADAVARRFAAQFAVTRTVLRKYSYENYPDPTREDLENMMDELGWAEDNPEQPPDEFDLGNLT